MKKSILIEKRKLARELKKKGWSNLKIGRYLVVNKNSIKKWLDMDEDDIGNDGRGWQKGKLKKHNEVERQRILKIRERLEQIPGAAIGPQAIKSEYRQRFGTETSEWFIKQTIREYKEKKRLSEEKIYSGHVEYPILRLRKLGKMVMCLDFMAVGPRPKSGERAYFLSCTYVHPYNSGMVSQVSARTSDEVIRTLGHIWRIYAKPDLVKMNYNPAFGANLSRQRCIGKLTICLLNLGITPFYSTADGADDKLDAGRVCTIFSKDFYRQLALHHSHQANLKIRGLYLEYSTAGDFRFEQLRNRIPSFKSPFAGVDIENRNVNDFLKSRIFFSCRVKAKGEEGAAGTSGVIKILAVEIKLPGQLIDAVMLCQLDLRKKN